MTWDQRGNEIGKKSTEKGRGRDATLPAIQRSFDNSCDDVGDVDCIDVSKTMTCEPNRCEPVTNLPTQDLATDSIVQTTSGSVLAGYYVFAFITILEKR